MTGRSLRIRIPHSVTRTTPLRDTVMFLALLVISTFAAGDALCYEANTTSFFYCQQQQYDSWGFRPAWENPARLATAIPPTANSVPTNMDAVLDSRTGRLQEPRSKWTCVDPKQGKAPIPLWGYSNYTYFGIGGLVIAASTWSDDNPTGAYAMSVCRLAAGFISTKDSDCPAIPDDARHLDPTRFLSCQPTFMILM